jgi:hypothetical protein
MGAEVSSVQRSGGFCEERPALLTERWIYPFAGEFWKLRRPLSCGVFSDLGALELYVL